MCFISIVCLRRLILWDNFDIDPTLVRLGWAALSLFSALFGGLILYIIAAVVIPTKSSVYPGC